MQIEIYLERTGNEASLKVRRIRTRNGMLERYGFANSLFTFKANGELYAHSFISSDLGLRLTSSGFLRISNWDEFQEANLAALNEPISTNWLTFGSHEGH